MAKSSRSQDLNYMKVFLRFNCKRMCVTFLMGVGGSAEKRPYDVSRGKIDMWRFPYNV